MKRFVILLFILIHIQVHCQIKKERPVFWVIPSINTKIDGLAVGLIINSMKVSDSSLTTIVNGLSLELIGVGLFIPLAPSNPIYLENDSFYYSKRNVDSIVNSYKFIRYRISGISCSLSGTAGHDIQINGINLSGLMTLIGKTNGISASICVNLTGVLNGVSFGVINYTIQTKGLQVGLINKTKNLKGFQIGLWNKNEKRGLPIINWSFK